MTDKMEQAFLDGIHPALTRDAHAASVLRSPPSPSPDDPDHDGAHSDDGDRDASGPTRLNGPPAPPPLRETTNARTAASRRRGEESRNTGVKGVRADYAEAMARQQQPSPPQRLAHSLERQLRLNNQDDDDDDDDDNDELALLRRKRLAELQGSGERRANGHGDGSRRLFGHLCEVGIEGFVAAVEDEDPETAVVVHLYEPEVALCALLNSHFTTLARLHPRTKFLRAQASELDFMQPGSDDRTSRDRLLHDNDGGGDNATLPTVLVYRAGELETTWVRFDFELPGGQIARGAQGTRQVEEVLYNAGVISSVGLASPAGTDGVVRASERTTIRSSAPADPGLEDGDDDEYDM
ncbi:hypothetical protein JCM3774_004462 [Rhodotorula dairenensis]